MVRTAARKPDADSGVAEFGDRRPLWWYARVIRRLCPGGGRLLDYGCGAGELLQHLTPHFDTFGYDEDPLLRHRCRTAVPDAVVLEEWDGIEAESCDVITAIGGWRGARPLEAVRKLAGKLAPEGFLFVVAPNPGGWAHRLKGRDWFASGLAGKLALLSRGEWVTLMRKADLRVVEIEGDGFWDAPYLPVIPAALQRAVCDVPLAAQGFWPISRSLVPAAFGESLLITVRKGS
jgi:SAM-dependent methyltransferase